MSLLLLLFAQTLPASEQISLSETVPVDFSWLFVKVVLVMGFVCLLAFLVIKYLLPKASFVKNRANAQIQIIERFGLEPKKNLYILEVSGKRMLVGTAEHNITSLGELPYSKEGELK